MRERDLRHGYTGHQVDTRDWYWISGHGNRDDDQSDGPANGVQTRDNNAARVKRVMGTGLLSVGWFAFSSRLHVQTNVQEAENGLRRGG